MSRRDCSFDRVLVGRVERRSGLGRLLPASARPVLEGLGLVHLATCSTDLIGYRVERGCDGASLGGGDFAPIATLYQERSLRRGDLLDRHPLGVGHDRACQTARILLELGMIFGVASRAVVAFESLAHPDQHDLLAGEGKVCDLDRARLVHSGCLGSAEGTTYDPPGVLDDDLEEFDQVGLGFDDPEALEMQAPRPQISPSSHGIPMSRIRCAVRLRPASASCVLGHTLRKGLRVRKN